MGARRSPRRKADVVTAPVPVVGRFETASEWEPEDEAWASHDTDLDDSVYDPTGWTDDQMALALADWPAPDDRARPGPEAPADGTDWWGDDDPWAPDTEDRWSGHEALPAPASVETPSEPEPAGWGLDEGAAEHGPAGDFPTAAVRLGRRRPQTAEAAEASRAAADVLVGLAATNDEASLRAFLRPDPSQAEVTWTVACYQIGDLTPCALMDFANPVTAVTTLAGCGEASHVAAELVASTPAGSRWTALTRTGQAIVFQLPDRRSATHTRADGVDGTQLATEHWRQQLHRWAADPPEDLVSRDHARPAVVAAPEVIRQPATPVAPRAPSGADDLERALSLVVATLHKVESDLRSGDQVDVQVLGRLDALERRVSDFEAAFEAALDHRVHTLARYCAELTRAFSAEQQAATARIEARLDDLLARSSAVLGSGVGELLAGDPGGDADAST